MAAPPPAANFHILIEEFISPRTWEFWPTTMASYQSLPPGRPGSYYKWQQGRLVPSAVPSEIPGRLIESASIGYRGPKHGLLIVDFDIRGDDIDDDDPPIPDRRDHGFSFQCASFSGRAPVRFNVGTRGNSDHIPPSRGGLPSWAALFPEAYQPQENNGTQLTALGGLHGRLTAILALMALYSGGTSINLHIDYAWPTWNRPNNANAAPNRIVIVSIYSSRPREDLVVLSKIEREDYGPIIRVS